MKRILNPSEYTFTPSTNQINFSGVSGFAARNLLAVISITGEKLIYSVASGAAGYGGSFSGTVLTYDSSNAGQSPSDILQIIYDDPSGIQNVTGQVTSQTLDSSGNGIGSVYDVSGGNKLKTASNTYAGDGTPILSTVDPISGSDGLNTHLQSSSFGGQIGNPIPIPNNLNALSVGFLNSSTGTLATPKMDPVTNELIVQGTFTAPALQAVDITSVDSAPISLGQAAMAQSLPVTLASDQTAIPITTTSPIEVTVGQSVSQDILGVAVGGNRNNQIEVSFNAAPGASLITNSFTGAGSVSITNGHSVYQTGSVGAAASAQAVSVQTTAYRPAHEIYAAFTAAFTNMILTRSDAKIGLFDATNGFFVGYDITQGFAVGVRSAGVDTITPRGSWNVDQLTGAVNSKFTRNGTPEAINFAFSNLFRIRFAWLGSANIYFEVFSPDAEWVLFHNIRQPNTSFNPSITSPNLPMTVLVSKTSGTQNSQVATACWGAGTTSAYSPITETLNDKSLAALTRSVITGVTTGGGGGYVNVKVNPSGALVTDSTISGTVGTNISQYGGSATTLGQKAMTASMPVVISSDQTAVNITLPDLFITGQASQSALINNILPSTAGATATDLSGYRAGHVQVVCSAGISAGAFVFEASNDNANFQSIPVLNQSLITGAATSGAISTLANTQIIYAFPITARYLRLRISTAVVGGTIQAFSRFTQAAYTPAITSVAQSTAAQLNTTSTVSGTLTSVGTITTVTGVTTVSTVSAVTSAALSSALVTDVNAVSVVATGNSANIAISNQQSSSFSLLCNYTAGTGTIDVTIQESYDNGTTWVDIYAFDRVSTLGANRQNAPLMRISNTLLRYSYVITGTVTTNAVTIIRTHRAIAAPAIRRIYNRTLDPTTLGSSSASLYTECCEHSDLIVNMAAGGTAPVIQLQGSEDGTNWYNIGTTLTATVGATTALGISDGSLPRFSRATVATAGAGSTLGYIAIKAKGSC